jgi:molybdenum cofactor sulfurtransferase
VIAGGLFGVAVIGSIIGTAYSRDMSGAGGAAEESVGAAYMTAQQVGGASGRELADTAGHAFTEALGIGLTAAAVVALAGALLVLLRLPGDGAPATTPAGAGPVRPWRPNRSPRDRLEPLYDGSMSQPETAARDLFDPAWQVQAEVAFLDANPAFRETAVLDELRASEYGTLDARGEVYLDYTGGGLYAASQLEEHLRLLRETVYGNPHSVNPTSSAATVLVERARAAVLRYFNAPESEYACIFTPNATGALRLVGEAYPFGPRDRFLATFDNHNSVNGIREFARAKGARTAYVPLEAPDLRVADGLLERYLVEAAVDGHNLFAYPAQSNFSGVKHPLEWIATAQERGWDVIVDAAAFVPSSRLDLSAWQPDFAPVSFYKMFGYPTGIGALLARRRALAKLQRPWFSGGTVVAANVQGEMVVPLSGHALFEDGTVNYLGIPAIEIGLRHIERIGIDTISRRVEGLGTWLLDELQQLRHSDGSPATRVYGPTTWDRRGATIAFNFLHPDGRMVDERFVDIVAAAHDISVRTGCFCNSGAGETAFSISRDTLIGAEFDDGMILDDYIRRVGMPTGGAVRVSLGFPTNFADVYRFMRFATEFRDVADVPADLPARLAC